MTLWEGSLLVEELIHQDGSIANRHLRLKLILTRTDLLHLAIRQVYLCGGVGRNFDIPDDLVLLLLPTALDVTIDTLIRSLDIIHLIDREVGLEDNLLESRFCRTDTGHILKQPRQ